MVGAGGIFLSSCSQSCRDRGSSFLFSVLRVAGGSCGVFDTSNDDVFLLAF
jgi:hypothetical protein